MAYTYMDVKLFNSYIGAALPVFMRGHAGDSSLCPPRGAAIRDFRFGAELWLLDIYSYCPYLAKLHTSRLLLRNLFHIRLGV